jgi:hypothetical protein
MVSTLLCHIRAGKSKEKIGGSRLRLIARWKKLRSKRFIRRAESCKLQAASGCKYTS